MIIKVGNVSLLPWVQSINGDWIRWEEYNSPNRVRLNFNKFSASWYPIFGGNVFYLKAVFEEHWNYPSFRFKHHQLAMEQIDKFLIRMGKLTIFL